MLKELVLLFLICVFSTSLRAIEFKKYCEFSAEAIASHSNDILFESYKGDSVVLDEILDGLDLEIRNKVFSLMGGFSKLETRVLGHTKDGFPVYLLKRGESLAWILKQYSRPRELVQDVRAFEMLQEFIKLHPQLEIKLPENQVLSERYLFVEYAPGRVLDEFGISQFMKSDTSLPLTIQDQYPEVNFRKVILNYAKLQEDLKLYLNKKYQIDESPFLFPEMIKVDSPRGIMPNHIDLGFNVFLHPENVLLDSRDGKLVIIDPY